MIRQRVTQYELRDSRQSRLGKGWKQYERATHEMSTHGIRQHKLGRVFGIVNMSGQASAGLGAGSELHFWLRVSSVQ